MFKCQPVLPRFNMSQNPAANTDDLPEVADARIWNLATVLHAQRGLFLWGVWPPRDSLTWFLGRGVCFRPWSILTSCWGIFPSSLPNNTATCSGWWPSAAVNSLLWALKWIFFLVACKDLKRAPCSLSQEGSYLGSWVGRGPGERWPPVWGEGSLKHLPALSVCLSLCTGAERGSAGWEQGSLCRGFLAKLDFNKGDPGAPSSFSGCFLEILYLCQSPGNPLWPPAPKALWGWGEWKARWILRRWNLRLPLVSNPHQHAIQDTSAQTSPVPAAEDAPPPPCLAHGRRLFSLRTCSRISGNPSCWRTGWR